MLLLVNACPIDVDDPGLRGGSLPLQEKLLMSVRFRNIMTMFLMLTHLQMIVSSPRRDAPYSIVLEDSYNRTGRALAGANNETLIQSLFNHDKLRDLMINKVIGI